MKQKRRKKPKDSWPGHAPVTEEKTKKTKGAQRSSSAPASKVPRNGSGKAKRVAPARMTSSAVATVARPRRAPLQRDDAPTGLYVVCAPGLEGITNGELGTLGVQTGNPEPGGVTLDGNADIIYRANLHLRSASRVLARVAEFRVTTFYDLEARARHIEWERWLGAEPVRVRVTCRKSKLYHSDAVAQRFVEAIAKRTGAWAATRDSRNAGAQDEAADPNADGDVAGGGEGGGEDAQLFIVRLLHDTCTVSVDTSGALLHRRGYRQAVAKAPLRETIAAAMVLASDWRGEAPLVDPLCGAGTIPIEGALIARRIAPGIGRGFAFMRWPSFDAAAWARHLAEAREQELPNAAAPIVGTDRDAGAIEAAMANATRAGVAADVELSQRSLSEVQPPDIPGWLITNPPYGVRVGAPDTVRDLYAQLGNVARGALPGWGIGFLSPDRTLDTQPRIAVAPAFETTNGGIKVRYLTGRVPGA
jgi:putative N6-adenine-specific DNA methylase